MVIRAKHIGRPLTGDVHVVQGQRVAITEDVVELVNAAYARGEDPHISFIPFEGPVTGPNYQWLSDEVIPAERVHS